MLIHEVMRLSELVNIIYGKNSFLNNNKLNEKVKKLGVEEININRYDLLETNNEDILEDLRTISFFSDNKIVIIDNFFELLNKDLETLNRWMSYLKKPNPDVFLFIILKELISEEHQLGKTLMQYAFLTEVKDMEHKAFPKYIEELLKEEKYVIDKKALEELLVRTNYNLNLIMQELEKLMLYKYNDKKITAHDVELLVSRKLEENIYELTNSLLKSNNNKTIQIYYDLLVNNEDPIRIINNVASRIRQLIHTKLLINKSFTQDDIMNHFNIRSGQAYYLRKDADSASMEVLESLLEKLSKLDLDIKTGKIEKKIGLEILILGA